MNLPSAAELLHPGEVEVSSEGSVVVSANGEGATVPASPPREQHEESTRFLSRARPGRYVVAVIVTAGALFGLAWGVAAIGSTSGAKGIGVYFVVVGVAITGAVAVVSAWRWAWRRRSGIPKRRFNPTEVQGGKSAE